MNSTRKITRATARSPEEWMELYMKKTGETNVQEPEGFTTFYVPTRGFAMFKADREGKILMIYHLCGDAKFWKDFGEILCGINGLKCICTIVTRQIDAYIRFWGWKKVKEEVNKYGRRRITCMEDGRRKIILTYKSTDEETNDDVYWLTYYLQERM